MTDIALLNIYHLLLLSEANKAGVIEDETYKNLLAQLLHLWVNESEE